MRIAIWRPRLFIVIAVLALFGVARVCSVAVQVAEQAVRRLGRMHSRVPAGQVGRTLAEALHHGGFASRAALFAEVGNLAALDQDGIVPRRLLDDLTTIAERAPLHAWAVVPVHADRHGGNWLASGRGVTALLDFEWARFGEPAESHRARLAPAPSRRACAAVARPALALVAQAKGTG